MPDDFDFSSFDDVMKMLDDDKDSGKSIGDQLQGSVGISNELLNEINSMAGSAPESGKNVFGGDIDADSTGTLRTVDAEIKITVKPGNLEALICVYAPQFGGRDVSLDDIHAEIDKMKITFGIDEEILGEIVTEKMYDTIFPFAHGEPAKNGDNGVVTPKFEDIRKLQPKILEDGSVDYRDIGSVVNISKGDTICYIKNASAGEPGKDIFGNTLFPVPGKSPTIPTGKNTGLNGDRSLLIALESGNLIYENGKYAVETVFTVKENVDISVGNISFLGDVLIKGNVDEGFTVISEKNITVNGMVNGATLKANGDIIIKNGAVNAVLLSRDGKISIGFGESSKIKCHGDFTANSLVSSMVECEGTLDCTKNPGTIVGGSYKIYGNVVCNTLGHRNYIATTITIGCFTSLMEERYKLEKKLEQIDSDIEKIAQSLDYLQSMKKQEGKLAKDKEDFMNAAIRLKMQKGLEKKPLKKRIMEIDSLTTNGENLTMRINRFLHPNVKINMSAFTTQTTTEYGKCLVYLTRDGIKIS